MSLKRPFVPKSDVKQRFTTTTTHSFSFDTDANYKLVELYKYLPTIHLKQFYIAREEVPLKVEP